MIDVIVDAPTELIRGSDVPSDITTNFGGTGMNVAMWARGSEVVVELIGAVGRDDWGSIVKNRLVKSGIQSRIIDAKDLPTGIVVALVHKDGERSFYPDFRANAAIVETEIDEFSWHDISVFVLSGYTLINQFTRNWAENLLVRAKNSGATVIIDPASSAPLEQVADETIRFWFEHATYIVPNEQEMELLKSREVLPPHVTTIEKQGAAGVTLHVPSQPPQHFPAQLAHVVDTIGAGDAFVGGFASALARGLTVTSAIHSGIDTARQAVEIRGAQPLV